MPGSRVFSGSGQILRRSSECAARSLGPPLGEDTPRQLFPLAYTAKSPRLRMHTSTTPAPPSTRFEKVTVSSSELCERACGARERRSVQFRVGSWLTGAWEAFSHNAFGAVAEKHCNIHAAAQTLVCGHASGRFSDKLRLEVHRSARGIQSRGLAPDVWRVQGPTFACFSSARRHARPPCQVCPMAPDTAFNVGRNTRQRWTSSPRSSIPGI